MDLLEHGLETLLQRLVLAALVEFAHKVPADLEGFVAEIEGGAAEVLEREREIGV